MCSTSIQPSLFETSESLAPEVSGLSYVPDFIAVEQEAGLIDQIDQQPWLTDLKRRVQHYGWRYDYTARRLDDSLWLGALPTWLQDYAMDLHSKGYFSSIPDQVIVNEYMPGQGIAPHIDCIPCFDGVIGSISLGSHCVMDFLHEKTHQKQAILLETRSLFILEHDARYLWRHGIAQRKTDSINGLRISRGRRLSLTFRKVITEAF